MIQYGAANYFKPNFFASVFGSREETATARSGYWRLFFMEMQEEALKKTVKEEAKKAYEKTVGDSGKLAASKVSTPPRKKQPKSVVPKKREKVEKPTPIIPFRKLPTKLEPTVYDELVKLPEIAIEQYTFVIRANAVLYNFEQEKQKRRKHRRKVAAFLLMAA